MCGCAVLWEAIFPCRMSCHRLETHDCKSSPEGMRTPYWEASGIKEYNVDLWRWKLWVRFSEYRGWLPSHSPTSPQLQPGVCRKLLHLDMNWTIHCKPICSFFPIFIVHFLSFNIYLTNSLLTRFCKFIPQSAFFVFEIEKVMNKFPVNLTLPPNKSWPGLASSLSRLKLLSLQTSGMYTNHARVHCQKSIV